MIRNRLLPTHIFAILVMGVASFLLVLAGILDREIAQYDSSDHGYVWELAFRNSFALVGTVLIFLSIGLIAFQKWAINGFLLLFWLAGIAWLGGAYLIARETRFEGITVKILIGSSILIYSALTSGILFLSSAQLRTLFYKKQMPEENTPDILDQL